MESQKQSSFSKPSQNNTNMNQYGPKKALNPTGKWYLSVKTRKGTSRLPSPQT